LLNINADTVAAAIGGALSAEKLCCAPARPASSSASTDPSSVISYTDIKGLKRCAIKASRTACCPRRRHRERHPRRRAPRARDQYKSTDSLLAEIFTNEGTGTLVVADSRP
jgi:acetylglutamate kinase